MISRTKLWKLLLKGSGINPRVVLRWENKSFYKMLKHPTPPLFMDRPSIQDRLMFQHHVTMRREGYKNRRIITNVLQLRNMKNVMNFGLMRKLQLISNRANLLECHKNPKILRIQLMIGMTPQRKLSVMWKFYKCTVSNCKKLSYFCLSA